MEIYAEIIINSDAIEIDRPFTYRVAKEMSEEIEVGHRVSISFGKIKGYLQGYVIGLKTEYSGEYKLKSIKKILDKEPILTREDLLMIEYLRKKTLCKYIDAIRLLVPVGITRGVKEKVIRVIEIGEELKGEYEKKKNYVELIEFVKRNRGLIKANLVEKGFSQYIVNNAIKRGFLKSVEEVSYRYNKKDYGNSIEFTLTSEQNLALAKIKNTTKKGILLHGVTGSGKTEVYMRLVRDELDKGHSAIILVPEISLTPQMIERFKERFGRDVALYHSKLSEGERYDEWQRVKKGQCKLVIGARSALFLPMQNLGLIVVDEEHESTYKSENNPKYITRDVCEYLSYIHGCKYILGSATPSIESYAEGLVGKLELVELKNRVFNKPLPTMEVVDMREELKVKNLSMFSRKLYKAIGETLEKKKQIILFLNRKGYSTFVSCRRCGYVFKCKKCDISMVYHREGYLSCNYCGHKEEKVDECPECGSKYVKFFGSGTEKVEGEVKKYFKDARIVRMDRDTIKNKNDYEKIYNIFKSGEADILIGTQMITKGHDFKGVELVGILAADMPLNIPDYRAGERTYQLITQVGGRAGRGENRGRVIIQTYNPKNTYIKYAVENNYKAMFKDEFKIRKLMNYPPFGRIVFIKGISKDETRLMAFMNGLKEEILKMKIENIEILGPSKCIIARVKGFFRYQILIKGKIDYDEILILKDKLYNLNKSVYNEIRISIDINPNNLL